MGSKEIPLDALREAQLAILRHSEQLTTLADSKTRGPILKQVAKIVDAKPKGIKSKTASLRMWAAFVLWGDWRKLTSFAIYNLGYRN